MLYFVFAGLDLRVWRSVKWFLTSVTSSEIPQVRYSLLSVCWQCSSGIIGVWLLPGGQIQTLQLRPQTSIQMFSSFYTHTHSLWWKNLQLLSDSWYLGIKPVTSAAVGSPIGCRGLSSPESHFLWKTGSLAHELPFHKPNTLMCTEAVVF